MSKIPLVTAILLAGLWGSARGAMVTRRWGVSGRLQHPNTWSYETLGDTGELMIVDRSGLPNGTRIHRARLFFVGVDWKEKAMRGVTPADTLLISRQQVPSNSALEVEKLLETSVVPKAELARRAIEPLMQQLEVPGTKYLAFSALPDLSSYSSGGLFRVRDLPGVQFGIDQVAEYRFGAARIALHHATVAGGSLAKPCRMPNIVFSSVVLLPDEVRVENGLIHYADDTLDLVGVPVSNQMVDKKGRVILCGPNVLNPPS